METITGAVTNVANVASRAIWGEGENPDIKKDANGNVIGKEPISGELGDVKSGEPYDKGNVDDDSTTTSGTNLPAKSTLTSNPKPTTTETTSDPSAGAVLLPESEASRRDTPSNLIADSNKPPTASQTLPSESSSESKGEALTFTKSDPATDNTIIGSGTGVSSTTDSSVPPRDMGSLEEKASAVPGTTGFDKHTPEPVSGSAGTTSTSKDSSTTAPALTGTTATQSSGLQKETVGSSGLLEEKRIKPESASEPKVGETSTSSHSHTTPASTTPGSSSAPKKSLEKTDSADGDKEKKSLKEKIKEKLHRHKD
ncbi:hypothetical protein VTL71DRAFT_105 [Oculimacula yallundae]|uniref:Uncharacterized protein n=1 Tax=Oculimacula yallundae TaxID=86028 RepID=A0ABR4CZ85_9HELO